MHIFYLVVMTAMLWTNTALADGPEERAVVGGMPPGDSRAFDMIDANLNALHRVFVVGESDQAGGTSKIIDTVLNKNIPDRGDCQVGGRIEPLLAELKKVIESQRSPEKKNERAPYQRLFSVSRSVAFIGNNVRAVLIVCDFCDTSILAFSRPGTDRILSPQVSSALFEPIMSYIKENGCNGP